MKITINPRYPAIWIEIGRWEFAFTPFRWRFRRAKLGRGLKDLPTGFYYRIGPFWIEKAPLPEP